MPRLPKGMFKRGGSYCTRLYKGGGDAWRSLGRDLTVARRKLKQLKGGAWQPTASLTVAQAATRWLAEYVKTNRNEKGVRLATQRVKTFLIPALGIKPLDLVSKADLRGYRLHLEGLGLSVQSVGHVLSDARCLFNWCVDSDLLGRSPLPRRLMPRLQEQPPKALLDREVETLCALPDPYGFVIRLAVGTGLRWSELCRAQAAHIEGDVLVVSQTKSGRVRRVPLAPELLREARGKVGRLIPFAPSSSGGFARTVRELSGIEGFHVHRLRHTFACRWIQEGRGTLHALQQLLGHASVVTTQRYARLTDEAVREEARRVHANLAAGDSGA